MSETADQRSSEEIPALHLSDEASPLDATAISRLAHTLSKQGDYQESCRLYQQLVNLEPNNGMAWVSLGHSYFLKGDYDACFSTYQKALNFRQEGNCEAQLWYGIGLLYSKYNEYEQAIAAFKHVFETDPDFVEKGQVWKALGYIYKEIRLFSEAISNLKLSLDVFPEKKQTQILCDLGVCYEAIGQRTEAIACYRRAIETDREAFKPLQCLGWALANTVSGVDSLCQALQCIKDNPQEEANSHYILGRIFYLQGRFSESLSEFQRADNGLSGEYLSLCSLGIAYAAVFQLENAVETLAKAAEICPERVEAVYNLGGVYESMHQTEAAREAYKKAAILDLEIVPNVNSRLEDLTSHTEQAVEYRHPEFEISEKTLSICKWKPLLSKAQISPQPRIDPKPPIFKITREDLPIVTKPSSTKKKSRISPPQNSSEMYVPMQVYCPQTADQVGYSPEFQMFPGYFQSQMMYYPQYMMPFYLPPQPTETGETKEQENTIEKDVGKTEECPGNTKVNVEDLISDCDSDQSDSGGSVDGIHIGGKHRNAPCDPAPMKRRPL